METIRRPWRPLAPEEQQPDGPKHKPDENLPDQGTAHESSNRGAKARRQAHDKHSKRKRDKDDDGNAQHIPAPPGLPRPVSSRLVDVHHLAGIHNVGRIDGRLITPIRA